ATHSAQGTGRVRPHIGLFHTQLGLHLVAHQVRVLPPLAALQVVHGQAVEHLGGVQGPLQPPLLACLQIRLGHQVLDLPLQLRLPEVDVLEALAHFGRGVLLGPLGQLARVGRQALGLLPHPLRVVPVGKGLVVARVVVLVPFLQQVLGRAEARRGQTRGGVQAGVEGRLVHLHGQLGDRDGLRGRPHGPSSPTPFCQEAGKLHSKHPQQMAIQPLF
uniref:Uncharacterized protein n=1 Tax=Anolis carolinensis TaxID=28377 RepID=A0A803TK65_ANOCA